MRQDQASVSLSVDGEQIPITFSKRSGGVKGSEQSKYPPGGMEPERSLGGRQVVEDVTISGEYRPELHDAVIRRLEARRGKGDAVVTEQPLDEDGVAFGVPKVWKGKLESVDTGEYDSTSTDARELTIVVSADGRSA